MNETPITIGRFPIIDTLGIGGMGVVYSAKDPDIGRLVAIKVLHSNGDKEALERFKNEARTIGEITHPNIVMLLEYGIDDKKPFLVMEHLAGKSLETWVTESHKIIEHKSILLDLCHALQYAHSKEILHRDLKPGNIQILPTGQAKLLDFGIARSGDTGLTATGFFIGTPQFLAPEILQSTNHSQASDCYSLGLLAYTMLSGRNPFAGKTFEATMTRQLTLIPTLLHELNSKIPVTLSKVIASYLEKNPEKRPQTPELLEKTLGQITSNSQLNKIINPTKESKVESSNTTILFSEQKPKSKYKYFILAFMVILIASFFANQYINKQESKPIANKVDNQNSVEPSVKTPMQKPLQEDTKPENNTSITKPDSSNDIKVENNLVETKSPTTKKPEVIENISTHTEKANKDENKPTKVEVPITKIIKGKKVQDTSNKKPTSNVKKTDNSDEENKDNKVKSITGKPIFTLPQLNHRTSKIILTAITNTNLSRGKTKTFNIETEDNIVFEKFIVYRGRSEFEQIKVLNFNLHKDNQTQLKIYVEPNTPLGDYALFGIYQNKKTTPIILKITL